MICLQLFWSFFQIGMFSVGGGYAAMPLIQEQVVDLHAWLTMGQFADIIAIAEMTPGPIAINAATFVGIRTAGLPGALAATLGCVTPSCAVVLLLAYLYYRFRGLPVIQGVLTGLRPAVLAMIASAGLSLLLLALFGQRELSGGLSGIRWQGVGIFLVSLALLRWKKLSPVWVLAGAGAAGVLLSSVL